MKPITELACDVKVPPFLVAGWIADDVKPAPFVALPMPLMFPNGQGFALPMTMGQRLYRWPSQVGPINRAGTFPGMASTPEELPQSDSGLPTVVMPKWPRGDDPIDAMPDWADQPALKVPLAELGGHGLKNVWTLAHPTLPMWEPKTMGGYANGSNSRFVISGVTRDGTGSPLGGCTVKVLLWQEIGAPLDPDPAVIAVQTSDAGGAYSAQVPKNVPHQLIGYLAGSPDRVGVTVNSIIPTEV